MKTISMAWQVVAFILALPLLGAAILAKEIGLWLLFQLKDEEWK